MTEHIPIQLHPDLYEALDEVAAQEKRSVGDIIYEVLADYILERNAIAAYEEWKRDPSTAKPWEEFEAELVKEGLLDSPDVKQAASPEEILEMAGSVYDGLTEETIDAIEAAILSDDHST